MHLLSKRVVQGLEYYERKMRVKMFPFQVKQQQQQLVELIRLLVMVKVCKFISSKSR